MGKSERGNNIYLFLKINFLLLANLLKATHTYSIKALLKKAFGLLKVSLFLVM